MLTKIDKYVYLPAVACACFMNWFLRFKERTDRIVILRPGGMGDLILCCAALESLGLSPLNYDWIIETRQKGWADYAGLNFYCYDELSWLDLRYLIGRYTVCINTEQRYGLSSAFAMVCIRHSGRLYGLQTNRASFLYRKKIDYDPFQYHELPSAAKLFADTLECADSPHPRLRTRLTEPSEYTVVSIAGRGNPAREFSASEWTDFIRKYAQTQRVIITAAPEDFDLATQIRNRFGESCEIYQGDFNGCCEIVKLAKRMLTVDGGMAHLASYFGLPVDAIFTSGRHLKWSPWSLDSAIIKRTDLDCQPCTVFGHNKPCNRNHLCKDQKEWKRIAITDLESIDEY